MVRRAVRGPPPRGGAVRRPAVEPGRRRCGRRAGDRRRLRAALDTTDPAYVLAVADSARFAYPEDESSWRGAGRVAVRGNQLTFPLTASHTSTDPCVSSYTQTAAATGSAAFVELAVTTTTVVSTPVSAVPSDLACDLVQTLTVDPPLVPGTPGTATITLADDLGNRPVVDARGVPWQVTVVS